MCTKICFNFKNNLIITSHKKINYFGSRSFPGLQNVTQHLMFFSCRKTGKIKPHFNIQLISFVCECSMYNVHSLVMIHVFKAFLFSQTSGILTTLFVEWCVVRWKRRIRRRGSWWLEVICNLYQNVVKMNTYITNIIDI